MRFTKTIQPNEPIFEIIKTILYMTQMPKNVQWNRQILGEMHLFDVKQNTSKALMTSFN